MLVPRWCRRRTARAVQHCPWLTLGHVSAGVEATECAYVESTVTDLPYFASKVTFGPEGVKTVHPIGELSAHEQQRLDELKPVLKEEIEAGLGYAKENSFA